MNMVYFNDYYNCLLFFLLILRGLDGKKEYNYICQFFLSEDIPYLLNLGIIVYF